MLSGKVAVRKCQFSCCRTSVHPPLAPPLGAGGCLAIIRVEDASLAEIVSVFEETINDRWMPKGTVVTISAGGHLANVGAAAYASDLVEAVNRIKRLLPPGSFVAHGLIAFACGINDPGIIRAVSDICTWQCVLSREGVVGDFLPITNKATIRLMERKGIVGNQTPLPLRISLPANMATGKTKTWNSAGVMELPLATLPLGEDDEAELLYYMCTELNRILDSGLATQLAVNRAASGLDIVKET